jgi:hypothetical protein
MPSFHDPLSRPVAVAVLLAALCPLLGSTPARADAASDGLLPGETLQSGQSLSSGRDALTMQGNGNLVLTAPGNTPLWSSHTSGNAGAQLVMAPGGNLAVVAPGGQTLWSAGTGGHRGSVLVLQPNGNAVVQAPGNPAPGNAPLWSTDTFRQAYADIQLRESKWDELAGSPASPYGIPQASPGAKMAAAGPDWFTSPQTQIRWGEDYIQGQYGAPCQAWAYWQVHKNY